jgi:hypothetical protein
MLSLSRTNQLLGAIVVLSALGEPSPAAAFFGGSSCADACASSCSTENCAIGCQGPFPVCGIDRVGCPEATPYLVTCPPEDEG